MKSINKHRFAERKAAGTNTSRITTQSFKITEEKALPF